VLGAARPRNSTVRRAHDEDAATLVRLRAALYPAQPFEWQAAHVARFFWARTDDAVIYMAESTKAPIGFMELSVRDHISGYAPGRIAYVQDWYVAPRWRGCGVEAALLGAGERWACASGCQALMAQVPLGHATTLDRYIPAYHALGFSEAAQITCFHKALPTAPVASIDRESRTSASTSGA
jgi:aminoglycoside 6'-N-acetyltransferase I